MASIKNLKLNTNDDVTFFNDSCVLDANFFKKYSIKWMEQQLEKKNKDKATKYFAQIEKKKKL